MLFSFPYWRGPRSVMALAPCTEEHPGIFQWQHGRPKRMAQGARLELQEEANPRIQAQ